MKEDTLDRKARRKAAEILLKTIQESIQKLLFIIREDASRQQIRSFKNFAGDQQHTFRESVRLCLK